MSLPHLQLAIFRSVYVVCPRRCIMIFKHRAKSLQVLRAAFSLLCLLCLFTSTLILLSFCDEASFLLKPGAIQPLRKWQRRPSARLLTEAREPREEI